jgi:hypothetical protein
MYTQVSPDQLQIAKHGNLIGRRMTAPSAYVIAQQYSTATFVLLHLNMLLFPLTLLFQNA